MARGANHSTPEVTEDTEERTEGPGRTPEGVGDYEIYRSPEAGAQVRILPGHHPLTGGLFVPDRKASRRVARFVARVESTTRSTSISVGRAWTYIG